MRARPDEAARGHRIVDRVAQVNAARLRPRASGEVPSTASSGWTERLSEIAVPTPILCGEEDVRMRTGHLDETRTDLQQSELVKIPAAGNPSNLENPDATNRAIAASPSRVCAAF